MHCGRLELACRSKHTSRSPEPTARTTNDDRPSAKRRRTIRGTVPTSMKLTGSTIGRRPLTSGDQRPVPRRGALVGVRMPGVVELGEQQLGELGILRHPDLFVAGSSLAEPLIRSARRRSRSPEQPAGWRASARRRALMRQPCDDSQRHLRDRCEGAQGRFLASIGKQADHKEGVMSWKSRRAQAAEYEGRPLPHPDEAVYDQGLVFDLGTVVSRRRLLTMIGAGAGVAKASGSSSRSGGAFASTTPARRRDRRRPRSPKETAGPFSGDGSNGLTPSPRAASSVVTSPRASATPPAWPAECPPRSR